MSSRADNILAGPTGTVQKQVLSLSRQADPAIAALLLTHTVSPSLNAAVRDQTLADPSQCLQFWCLFDVSIGIITRSKVYIPVGDDAAEPVVLAIFS